MSSLPPERYVVEVLTQAPATVTKTGQSSSDIEVEIGSISTTGELGVAEVIEVATYPPVGGGYHRVEVLPFTRQGTLTISPAGSEFPIAGGTFQLESIAGRVTTPSQGSPIIFDVLKNGVSVFADPADRPQIEPGQNVSVIGEILPTMFAEGDYVEVIIVAVGSTFPGANLVVSIRLTRIG